MSPAKAGQVRHAVRIVGSTEEIEVGKILCLGRNYAKHAREMGGTTPEEPIVFLKPRTALLEDGGTIRIPRNAGEAHHEVEIVVAVADEARDLPQEKALERILGYGVGIDVTLRSLQTRARERGEPWSIAKGFDTSAPVSPLLPRSSVSDWKRLRIELRRNGEIRQIGLAEEMVFGIPSVISYLSRFFTLERGDLIFMGTPEGVGPIESGDLLDIRLADGDVGPDAPVPVAATSGRDNSTAGTPLPGMVRARFHVGESP